MTPLLARCQRFLGGGMATTFSRQCATWQEPRRTERLAPRRGSRRGTPKAGGLMLTSRRGRGAPDPPSSQGPSRASRGAEGPIVVDIGKATIRRTRHLRRRRRYLERPIWFRDAPEGGGYDPSRSSSPGEGAGWSRSSAGRLVGGGRESRHHDRMKHVSTGAARRSVSRARPAGVAELLPADAEINLDERTLTTLIEAVSAARSSNRAGIQRSRWTSSRRQARLAPRLAVRASTGATRRSSLDGDAGRTVQGRADAVRNVNETMRKELSASTRSTSRPHRCLLDGTDNKSKLGAKRAARRDLAVSHRGESPRADAVSYSGGPAPAPSGAAVKSQRRQDAIDSTDSRSS